MTEIKDADYKAVDTAIKRHIQAVRREGEGTISFVYYSGHGAADPDTKINYLIPVDVTSAEDQSLWITSLSTCGSRLPQPPTTSYSMPVATSRRSRGRDRRLKMLRASCHLPTRPA